MDTDENKDMLEKIGHERRKFRAGTLNSFGTYLGAAFGFVIGLAWNNAIQALINYYVPNKGSSVAVQFIYAVALTLIVAIGTYTAIRITRRNDD